MQTSDRDITTYWNIASGSKHSQVQQLKCTEKEPVGVAVAENAKVILCHLFETELEWNGRCLVGPSLFCKTLFTFGKFFNRRMVFAFNSNPRCILVIRCEM